MSRCSALALLVLAVLGAPAESRAAGPRVAAHRGGALLWPENSLRAFRGALGLGADFLETDVHLSADGEVMVIHDPTLERTTTGRGAVRANGLGDLGRVRLKTADGAVTDEPVPTLGALLDLLKPGRASLLLEIKVGPDRQRYPGIEEKVLALVRARDLASRVRVMAFETATLARVRELDATIPTVLLIGRRAVEAARAMPKELVDRATSVGATDLGLEHHGLEAGLVSVARAAGLGLAVWTVNDERDMRRLVDLNVDLLISDRPDLALRVLGR